MRITIIATNKDFDLPRDLVLQLTKYNTMITESGEQSNPIVLPPTAHNMSLVGFSNRMDSYYKPLKDIDVLFVNGFTYRKGNLGIHTVDEDLGISCTLYLGTGDFYSKVGNTRLNWLAWPKIKSPTYETDSYNERVDYLITTLKQQFDDPDPAEDYKIAPVVTSETIEWFDDGVSRKRPFILNGFEDYYFSLPAEGEVSINVFQGEYAHSIVQDNDVITLGRGYGMTPFLKLKYVLKFIFQRFGYLFDTSRIDAIAPKLLEETVILNNVADAIYSGIIRYSQLVPDVQISDFLRETERLLAGKFIVNETKSSVSFIFYKNIFESAATLDLSDYLSTKVKVLESEFKVIKVSEKEKLTKPDEDEATVVRFEFDLLKTDYIEILFPDNFEEADGSISIQMIQTGSVIYLNSTLILNEKTIESEDKAAATVQLFTVPNIWNDQIIMDIENKTLIVNYRECYPYLKVPFPVGIATAIEKIEWLYSDYFNFQRHSNIPVTAQFVIPEIIMSTIDEHVPVLLNSQKLLIEHLKYPTSGDSVVEARFRTMRNYQ